MPTARWIASAVTLACGAILATLVISRMSREQRGHDLAQAAEAAAARKGATADEPIAGPETEFPSVEGRYALTGEWSIDLPGRFKRRLEEGDMYLWRPGFTVIVAVWDHSESSASARLAELKLDVSRGAYDLVEETQGETQRLAYRLHEASEDQRQDGFYAFVVGKRSYVQLTMYFDDARDVDAARALWRSVAEAAPAPAGR